MLQCIKNIDDAVPSSTHLFSLLIAVSIKPGSGSGPVGEVSDEERIKSNQASGVWWVGAQSWKSMTKAV
jgi:hypothetical protein